MSTQKIARWRFSMHFRIQLLNQNFMEKKELGEMFVAYYKVVVLTAA